MLEFHANPANSLGNIGYFLLDQLTDSKLEIVLSTIQISAYDSTNSSTTSFGTVLAFTLLWVSDSNELFRYWLHQTHFGSCLGRKKCPVTASWDVRLIPRGRGFFLGEWIVSENSMEQH
jgi:hypothetical protein